LTKRKIKENNKGEKKRGIKTARKLPNATRPLRKEGELHKNDKRGKGEGEKTKDKTTKKKMGGWDRIRIDPLGWIEDEKKKPGGIGGRGSGSRRIKKIGKVRRTPQFKKSVGWQSKTRRQQKNCGQTAPVVAEGIGNM